MSTLWDESRGVTVTGHTHLDIRCLTSEDGLQVAQQAEEQRRALHCYTTSGRVNLGTLQHGHPATWAPCNPLYPRAFITHSTAVMPTCPPH